MGGNRELGVRLKRDVVGPGETGVRPEFLTLIAREVHKAAITRDHVLSCHHQDSAMVLFTKGQW